MPQQMNLIPLEEHEANNKLTVEQFLAQFQEVFERIQLI
jgi:hypothetical protein